MKQNIQVKFAAQNSTSKRSQNIKRQGVLVMLGSATNMQGSIRTDFKRMAKVLDEEGLEKHGEVLKKAWDIPDPKYINKQTMYNTKLVVVLVVA